MTHRRARASVLLLWLVACGGGGGGPPVADPCAIPADGAGFLVYTADGDPDPEVVDLEVRAIKTDGTCDQQVGNGPDYDVAPSWSGTTGKVAWASWRSGQARIVLQDARGGPSTVLDTGPEFASGPALSSDGQVVAFERLAAGDATGDIYQVPVGGGTPVELVAGFICVPNPAFPDPGDPNHCLGTCPANDAGPIYSDTAEGRFLYFVSTRASSSCAAGSQTHDVWRQALDQAWTAAGAPERVTTGAAVIGRPAVSPDGKAVAYARGSTSPTSFAAVVLHSLASGQERVVTDQSDSEPDFSTTGDTLVVRSNRFSELGDLLLIDVASGAARGRLTSGEILVGSPAFPR